MADDEQFSLCWNNFNSNLSAGFHESLVRGDLVDVTLAAEGQFVKAHRLVLSVCSPYFRKMFTQMPANQHAFVFMKDVSHSALKDLIQFMYCGEVNVKQEALPAFISTAEALQIKGLTDGSDPPPLQSPAEASPPPPPPPIQQTSQPAPRIRQRSSRSYKVDTIDDSGDDQKQTTQIVIQTAPAPSQTIVSQPQHITQSQQSQTQIANIPATTVMTTIHKRPARSSAGGGASKRTKSTIDTLESTEPASTAQIQTAVVADIKNQQTTETTEYIDLPIEIPTKSEPDYSEEAGDVDSGEQDTNYVEDDTYGDMRYDESYFTENEDGANVTGASGGSPTAATTSKAVAKSFSESSYVDAIDQNNSEAQAPIVRKRGRPKIHRDNAPVEKLMDKLAAAVRNHPGHPAKYASTTKGTMKLLYDGHHFRYSFRKGQYSIFQCCYKENKEECKVRVVTDQKRVYPLDGEHVHFIQAHDKSVTSIVFEPGEENDQSDSKEITTPKTNTDETRKQFTDDGDQDTSDEELINYIRKTTASPATTAQKGNVVEATVGVEHLDFRNKIKERLEKALQNKTK